MLYFLDTEYSQLVPNAPIELISIALVAEDGREFYAESAEFGPTNPFVTKFVLPQLAPKPDRSSLTEIRDGLFDFIGGDTPIFVGQCCAFDYVVLSNLVGTFDQWPRHWPRYIEDLQSQLDFARNQGVLVPHEASQSPHHALYDAYAVRSLYYALGYIRWELDDEEDGLYTP